MKKIIIEHFSSLDNYGTGMMGLVTINELGRRLGAENVEFHCDFDSEQTLENVRTELGNLYNVFKYTAPDEHTAKETNVTKRRLQRLWHLLFSVEARDADMLIVLGGDDLSEYYGKYDAAISLFKKWKASFATDVVLLGQTIGPFTTGPNLFAARRFLPRMEIYSRDKRSSEYLEEEFGVRSYNTGDLAFLDLPLQNNENIVLQTMNKFNLIPDEYITLVISGGQSGGKYYCISREMYIQRYKELITELCADQRLAGKKIVLLAHTFGRYGEESSYIDELERIIPVELQSRMVYITEKILPTRARMVLGNGSFTITGRMHAAVSTFQAGKPAICLSYSMKFAGVIGDNLGRDDLTIGADNNAMWESGDIVPLVMGKVDLVLNNYETLGREIRDKVSEQQKLVNGTFDEITQILWE